MIYVRGFVTFAVGPSHTAFQNTQQGKRRGKNLKSSCEDLGTYITPNYQNFLQPLQTSPLFVRLTKYLQWHWRVYNACVPTWLAKTLLLFLPRWVLLHNGGLEGSGLRAGLPNKALVACSRQESVFASRLPKTNFQEVFCGMQWQQHDSVRFRYLGEWGGLVLRNVGLLWRSRELVQEEEVHKLVVKNTFQKSSLVLFSLMLFFVLLQFIHFHHFHWEVWGINFRLTALRNPLSPVSPPVSYLFHSLSINLSWVFLSSIPSPFTFLVAP